MNHHIWYLSLKIYTVSILIFHDFMIVKKSERNVNKIPTSEFNTFQKSETFQILFIHYIRYLKIMNFINLSGLFSAGMLHKWSCCSLCLWRWFLHNCSKRSRSSQGFLLSLCSKLDGIHGLMDTLWYCFQLLVSKSSLSCIEDFGKYIK